VVAIECCVVDDHLLVFTMAEQASVVTCWDGHSKELIKNVYLSEMGTITSITTVRQKMLSGENVNRLYHFTMGLVTISNIQVPNLRRCFLLPLFSAICCGVTTYR